MKWLMAWPSMWPEASAALPDLMNQEAASLGCTNTHFVNPNGLNDSNHYTTARDMALDCKGGV